MTRRLTLYGHGWCSLCETMLAELRPWSETLGFSVSVVDIEEDPALEARYAEDVPVLCAGTTELCP